MIIFSSYSINFSSLVQLDFLELFFSTLFIVVKSSNKIGNEAKDYLNYYYYYCLNVLYLIKIHLCYL